MCLIGVISRYAPYCCSCDRSFSLWSNLHWAIVFILVEAVECARNAPDGTLVHSLMGHSESASSLGCTYSILNCFEGLHLQAGLRKLDRAKDQRGSS
ncbi:hypothetical protein RchiOBHm_Chr1g0339661 [Rosa chinensis]|uniref:Uncharacterized protein n=2 Tax=Rosa chinensis TaxID=74649 RepID=A0A2P6SDB5_ROSCH|nr:hypothetical protein RchiOBHm_Chr1g0339661 [Rosa chinensis]